MQRCLRCVLCVDQAIFALDLSILITKDDAVSMAGMANIRAAGELVSRPVATQPLHLQRIVCQAFLGQTQVAAQLGEFVCHGHHINVWTGGPGRIGSELLTSHERIPSSPATKPSCMPFIIAASP